MEETTLSLRAQYEKFKLENPKVRIRDAAKQLGVSEAELVATSPYAIRLQDNMEAILQAVPSLGYVMALTRNDFAVHERKGAYRKVGFSQHIGLVVNPDIDLRLFMNAWKYAFAVTENDRKSLQFFGKDGEAIHKIYLQENSDWSAYEKLIDTFKVLSPAPLAIESYPVAQPEKRDHDVEVSPFQDAWRNLKDTHDFHGLLKEYGLTRTQAMRLAPEGYVKSIPLHELKTILEEVSVRSLEIMVFIGNRGCIQIHTGLIQKLLQTGPWFNVLDPEFNMHLREDAIANIWVVKKPTTDGHVTSIEAYDATGDTIVQFFGKRKPGIPEREDWRQLIKEITGF